MVFGHSDPRAIAAQLLVQVRDAGRSLSDVLPAAQANCRDDRDAALIQELVFGTARWYYRLDAMLAQLLRKPLKARDADLHCLLLIGLYQLDQLAVPERVAVHETVQAVRTLNKDWASGVANAVLRNFVRQRRQIEHAIESDQQAVFAHPAWLVERFRRDWPVRYREVLQAGNERPPLSIRVNRRRITRDEYLDVLRAAGLEAVPIAATDQGIALIRPVPVSRLPGFQAGDVSVQDGAAQLAAPLLDVQAGMRVLDACAAPGGKAAHLLELQPAIRLLALDRDAARLQRVQENMDRLALQAELLAADASDPDAWWDEKPFDRILLDAPCSATGVIRRHPDIKLLRRESDIEPLVARQAHLLNALWPLLSPGGILLYCTCSVIKAENSDRIAAFLAEHDDAVEQGAATDGDCGCAVGRQMLPGDNAMDGFFYACLRKVS